MRINLHIIPTLSILNTDTRGRILIHCINVENVKNKGLYISFKASLYNYSMIYKRGVKR